MNIKEARWAKIEQNIKELRELHPEGKAVVFPNPIGGYDAVALSCFVNESITETLEMAVIINKDRAKIKGEEFVKNVALKSMEMIYNNTFLEAHGANTVNASVALWQMIAYFHTKNSVEVFEDKDIVFIDLNFVELPND